MKYTKLRKNETSILTRITKTGNRRKGRQQHMTGRLVISRLSKRLVRGRLKIVRECRQVSIRTKKTVDPRNRKRQKKGCIVKLLRREDETENGQRGGSK